jgi:hypothetical protein
MPFSAEFDAVFRDVIVAALSPIYVVERADSRLHQQNILRTIIEGIHGADLVIADVTTTNANVMYELGAAHALGKPTIMISQSIERLPFDLRSYLVQAYSVEGDRSKAIDRLRDVGEKHILGMVRFGNPISDFVPNASDETTFSPVSDSATYADTSYGLLDYNADMEQFGDEAIQVFARADFLNQTLNTNMRELIPEMQKARNANSARAERSAYAQLSALLESYASAVLSDIVPQFHDAWEGIGKAMHWFAMHRPADADPQLVSRFCETGFGLRNALTGMVKKVTSVRETIGSASGVTQVLQRGISAFEESANAVISEVMIADAMLASVHARMGCPEYVPQSA